MAANRSSILEALRRRPRLVLLLSAGVALAAIAAGYASLSTQQARQEQEELQQQRLRIETRQKVLALQRQEEELIRQEEVKQELAARDTAAFQLASLQNDLQKQEQEVRILRREAAEREAKLMAQERERRRKELDQLLRDEFKTELDKTDSASCIQAYDDYKRKKADPTTPAAEVKTSLGSLRELCNSKAGPAAG